MKLTATSILASFILSPGTYAAEKFDNLALGEAADRYCIVPDGDHRLTWHLAEQDEFTWLTADHFPDLDIPHRIGSNLRGLEKTVDETTIRIMTSAFIWGAPDDGLTYFRQCWVSSSRSAVDDVNDELKTILNVRRFKTKQTFIYAWIPLTDGSRRTVGRREFQRHHLTRSREEGMRHLTVRQYGPSVFVGYASPRDEKTYSQFDWAGPEPLQAPD